jgi:hypothetical protein
MLVMTISVTFLLTAKAEVSPVGPFGEILFTYEMGYTSVNYPSPLSNSTGTAKGFGMGGRIGFHLNENIFLGFDGRFSMPRFEDSSVDYDSKAVSTNWGPVVGMQVPDLGTRMWGSYVFDGDLNPEKSGSFDLKFQGAKGFRVGVGNRWEQVSFNLEYQQLKYNKTSLEQLGPFSPGSSLSGVQLENTTWIVSASLPLAL